MSENKYFVGGPSYLMAAGVALIIATFGMQFGVWMQKKQQPLKIESVSMTVDGKQFNCTSPEKKP